MTNSIHNAYMSENARQFTDKWEANRIAAKYNLSRTKNQNLDKDVLVKTTNSKTIDGKNDGKISLKEKAENFYKGLTAPIYSMLETPSNFLLTLAGIGTCAGLIALTGGILAPVLVGAGLIGGGFAIGNGILKQSEAKTDEAAQKAWQNIGTGTFTMGLSVLGVKSLKGNNVNGMQNSNTIQSSVSKVSSFFKTIKQYVTSKISKFSRNSAQSAGAAAETADVTKNSSGIIKVSGKDIEVLPPEIQKTSNNTNNAVKKENIIDAEYTEVKNTSQTPKLLSAPK